MTFYSVIYYVADIKESLLFFKKVFDLEAKFVHESGDYAELNSGTTSLAFVSEDLASSHLSKGFKKNSNKELPLGCEIVFTSKDVEAMYQKALKNGAKDISAPAQMPWGQTVAYVRDPNGILVEIASPVS